MTQLTHLAHDSIHFYLFYFLFFTSTKTNLLQNEQRT
jgi:hypothetical protein